jgi:hypothetical protein
MKGPFLWNEMEDFEKCFDSKRCRCHGNIEDPQQECADAESIVFAVDVEDREHDEIGEKERNHPAKAYPPISEHRCERDIANGTDKGKDCDNWSNLRSPQLRENRDALEEKMPAKNY